MRESKIPLITVPTYWFSGRRRDYRIGDVFYDHPTPIDRDGTLARLLKSLENLKGDFMVVVITSVVESELEDRVERKIESIISPFKSRYPILQFGSKDLKTLKSRLRELGFSAYTKYIDTKGYGNVRNIQLIVAQILKVDVVVGLDDDEVITDDSFLKKALEYVGKKYEGKFVGGVGGFYVDPENGEETIMYENHGRKMREENIFFLKREIMDRAMEMLKMKKGRLVETPLMLGGNMIFHRDLFRKVPFDPYIPRGEDIDYLINARLLGYTLFIDKELFVLHLPPYALSQLSPDIARFLYERHKLVMAEKYGMGSCTPESLDPYPGLFLREDVEKHALDMVQRGLLRSDFVNEAKKYAQEKLPHFFEFMEKWPKLMDILGEDEVLRESFRNRLFMGGERR